MPHNIPRVPTVEEIAAELTRKLAQTQPKVYLSDCEDKYLTRGWDLLPEPYPSWKEPQA